VDRCDQCGFDYDLHRAPLVGSEIVTGADQLAALVERSGGDVRNQIEPGTWSPLEYGCHLRDVLLVQRERVLLARRVEQPRLESMGPEERAEHDGYADHDPTDVARQLSDAARMFDNVLGRLAERDWDLTVVYNYPTPTVRSLRWLALHTAHEVVHHLRDVERQLPQ
jgi:hypothetical protein